MSELVFDVTQEADGGYVAEALGENIVTQADTWEELREMAIEATQAYFFDGKPPDYIRLYFRRDEVMKVTPLPADAVTL